MLGVFRALQGHGILGLGLFGSGSDGRAKEQFVNKQLVCKP